MYATLTLFTLSTFITATEGRPDVLPWWAPFSMSAELGLTVGSGTFVSSRFADDPYWSSYVVLTPSWSLGESRSLSLNLEASYEFTYLVTPCRPASTARAAGAPALDCSDANDFGRRGQFEDIDLIFTDDALLELENLSLGGRFTVSLPTGYDSNAARNLFTLRGGLQLNGEFDVFTPRLWTGFSKYFPTREGRALDAAEINAGAPIGRCASFREKDCILLAGFVPTWRAGFEVGTGIEIPWVEGLSFDVEFGYRYTRAYGRTPDNSTSTRRDAQGNIIADGVNAADTTSGNLSFSYAIDNSWSASFGLSSLQPAKTADGRAMRFPFYDFISPANNYSAWYLSLSYNFSGSTP